MSLLLSLKWFSNQHFHFVCILLEEEIKKILKKILNEINKYNKTRKSINMRFLTYRYISYLGQAGDFTLQEQARLATTR